MSFAEIHGHNIYYEIQGTGIPIVLMHHGFASVRMWDKIVPRLVEQGFKTICYDRRGFGQSEAGDDFLDFYVDDGYREASVVELEALRNCLGISEFHLLGQCEGGVIALDYAWEFPERVMTVTISSTLCHGSKEMWNFNEEKFVKDFDQFHPEQRAKFMNWHGEKAETLYNQFRHFGGAYGKYIFDLRPILPWIRQPVLIIYPDRSFLFDVEQGLSFYRLLPDSELAVLPNCGHNTYDEQPEAYIFNLVNFLNRHRFGTATASENKITEQITCLG